MTIVNEEDHLNKAKPFEISKYAVLKAYERVKANKGSEGVDGITIEEFESRWKEKEIGHTNCCR